MAEHRVTTVTFSCDLCEKSFPNSDGINHVPIEGGERVHVCVECRAKNAGVAKLLEVASAMFIEARHRKNNRFGQPGAGEQWYLQGQGRYNRG